MQPSNTITSNVEFATINYIIAKEEVARQRAKEHQCTSIEGRNSELGTQKLQH